MRLGAASLDKSEAAIQLGSAVHVQGPQDNRDATLSGEIDSTAQHGCPDAQALECRIDVQLAHMDIVRSVLDADVSASDSVELDDLKGAAAPVVGEEDVLLSLVPVAKLGLDSYANRCMVHSTCPRCVFRSCRTAGDSTLDIHDGHTVAPAGGSRDRTVRRRTTACRSSGIPEEFLRAAHSGAGTTEPALRSGEGGHGFFDFPLPSRRIGEVQRCPAVSKRRSHIRFGVIDEHDGFCVGAVGANLPIRT